MIIKISNLSDGIHDFEFDEPVENINLEEPFFGNIKVKGNLSKSHNQVVLSADISADVNYECDRCSTDFKSVLKTSYRMVYFFEQSEAGENDVNITYLPPEIDKINISEEVRDYALLSVPMKKLCREDCKGLCYKCGKNLNEGPCNCETEAVDPRWQPLMDLRKKLNNN